MFINASIYKKTVNILTFFQVISQVGRNHRWKNGRLESGGTHHAHQDGKRRAPRKGRNSSAGERGAEKKNAELKEQIVELNRKLYRLLDQLSGHEEDKIKVKMTNKRRIIVSDPESSDADEGMEMDPASIKKIQKEEN